MTPPSNYFILVYRLSNQHVEVHEYGSDADAATVAYSELEDKYDARRSRDVEVVLVGADSLETIHRTHSHYFVSPSDDTFDRFLTEVLADK